MMRNAYDRTYKLLTEHRDKLNLVAETLIEREKINAAEFDSLMKEGHLPVEDTAVVEPVQNETESSDNDLAENAENEAKQEDVSDNVSEETASDSNDDSVSDDADSTSDSEL